MEVHCEWPKGNIVWRRKSWKVRSFPWSLLRKDFHDIKEVYVVFFCLKRFSLKTNSFYNFSANCLIYLLFCSNKFAWKTQWSCSNFLGKTSNDVSVQDWNYYYDIYWMPYFFSLINVLIFLLNHGGSLSLHKIVSCRIKLPAMSKRVFVKIPTFSSTVVFKNALCQLNSLIALFISSVLASLYCQTSRK